MSGSSHIGCAASTARWEDDVNILSGPYSESCFSGASAYLIPSGVKLSGL